MRIELTILLAPVYRLRATFAEVDKLKDGRYLKMWQELSALTSSDKAYAVLRKEIKSITPPCIPYLGMYLTDLTFVEVRIFLSSRFFVFFFLPFCSFSQGRKSKGPHRA